MLTCCSSEELLHPSCRSMPSALLRMKLKAIWSVTNMSASDRINSNFHHLPYWNELVRCSPCGDSLTTAAIDEAWVDPLLPNMRLKLLTFSSCFFPFSFTPFHYITSPRVTPPFASFCFFISFFFPTLFHIPLLCSKSLPTRYPTTSTTPLVCAGLTSGGDGQEVLDWLDEVEEGRSDWLNGFFTFLYGLINPLESLEEEQHSASEGFREAREDEDEDDEGFRKREENYDGSQGQKIVIVGLHNQ